MDVFDEALKSEAQILEALRLMEDEEARLRDDARKISENMRDARSIASTGSGRLRRISNEDR